MTRDAPLSMTPIRIELTTDELNLVLQALGKLPFEHVYALIQNLHQQAAGQLPSAGQGPAR